MTHKLTTFPPEYRSAEALLRHLLDNSNENHDAMLTLCRLVQLGMEQMQGGGRGISFRAATEARLQAASHRRAATIADLRSYTQRFLGYASFAEKELDEIATIDCQTLLDEHFSCSPAVYRKAKTILQSIFSFAQRRDWCRRNPASIIITPPVTEERLTPLEVRQIAALIRACNDKNLRRMEPAVRLMLWCGIRPMEVRRLRWRDIDRCERCVYVEPRNSKTGGARAVPLRGGALTLLREKHRDDEMIAPRDWQRLWRRLRDRARLHPWRQDTLRHTFASMHLKHFHNIVLLQEEMGHRDCNLLRSRYLNLRNIKKETAELFFKSRWEKDIPKRPCRHRRAKSDK